MSDAVSVSNRDGVAVVTLNNPPVNGLGFAVRTGLQAALETAATDDAVRALVITGSGRMFSGGADISEFGKTPPPGTPHLPTLIDAIEASEKPVVAAIHGVALGGGFEVALGCHVRLAAPGTRVGLPEVTLGILPGAGGTQRLPRLIGIPAALDVIVSGKMVPSAEARALGMIDDVVGGDIVDAAVSRARRMVAESQPPRRTSALDDRVAVARGKPEIFEQFRKKMARRARGFDAPYACVDCIEAAVNQPFAEGLDTERETFLRLVASDQSTAQRHAFFAEREVAKIPDVPRDTPTRPIETAAVIGCGTMGGGIAMNFANAGISVTVFEVSQDALDTGLALITKNYTATVSKGRLSQEAMDTRLGLISTTVDYGDLGKADVVIEAVFEEMKLKKEVFGRLDAVCKPEAILASNTSTLDVNEIASATNRPGQVIGTHFFSPANVMKLMENVRGAQTSPQTIATIMKLSKALGKVGVLVGVCDGFVGNRMLYAYRRQADFLLEEGALPTQIDTVIYDLRLRHADGAVCHGRPGGARRRLADPQGAGGHPAETPPLLDRCRPGLRAGPVWAENRRRLAPLRAGQPDADPPTPRSSSSSCRSPRNRGSPDARSPTRRSSSAACTRWSTKAPRSSKTAWPCDPATSTSSRSTATASRAIAAARCSGRSGRRADDLRRDEPATRRARRLAGAGAAIEETRRARQGVRRPVTGFGLWARWKPGSPLNISPYVVTTTTWLPTSSAHGS